MTDEKQIEELKQLNELATIISGTTELDTKTYYKVLPKAKKIIEQGYRNCKDKVVLTKEESIDMFNRKADGFMTSPIGDLPLNIDGMRKAVDEIARLNRVETELQELNANYYNEAKDLRRELKRKQVQANDVYKAYKLGYAKGRRERTNEIFNKIFALHGNRGDIMYIEIEELAKRYGVEEKDND